MPAASHSRSRVTWSCLATALLAMLFGLRAQAIVPEPSAIPVSWELAFKHSVPKRIVVDVPGETNSVAFWYMTYTVTNNSDREQMFLPSFDMLLVDGNVLASDRNIPKAAFDAVRNREGNRLLEPITSVRGPIRLGPAEARDSVAIWPEKIARMGHFSVFVTGLSGEAINLKKLNGDFVPTTNADDLKDMTSIVILRKTLQLNFLIRGDEVYPGEDQVNVAAEAWIMR